MEEERKPRKVADQPDDDRLEVRQDGRAEPRKPHGDALIDGSGTRHGVDSRDERPGVGRSEERNDTSDRVRDRDPDELEVRE